MPNRDMQLSFRYGTLRPVVQKTVPHSSSVFSATISRSNHSHKNDLTRSLGHVLLVVDQPTAKVLLRSRLKGLLESPGLRT